MLISKIKQFFKIDDDYSTALISLLLTAIVCFASYNAFISYGFNSPDGILEGFHYYINRHWALAGCGRWFLALINNAHANIVAPWLTIMECCIINWLSVYTLCKILDINKKIFIYLLCIFFSVIPTFIEIYLYTNSAFSYSVSIYLSILFVYFNLKNSYLYSIISAVCLGCAMGSYQSQIGVAVGLTVICIIKKILEDDSVFIYIIKSLVSGLLGLLVYIVGLNICLFIYRLELYSRASSFSISEVINRFPNSIVNSYSVFIEVFDQAILKRRYIFLLIAIVLAIELIILMYNIIKEKEYYKLIVLVLIAVLPIAFNFIGIILPMYEITSLMFTPNYLILFFAVYLLGYIKFNFNKIISIILSLLILMLSWTYVLSANATYESYKLSYNAYKMQFASALDMVYQLQGYEHNNTQIAVVGYPNDHALRDNVKIYNYAIGLHSNLLYWQTPDLDFTSTYFYLLNEFGINTGVTESDCYKEILNDQNVKDMPTWPSKDSVQMVNGYAVIKFGEPNE